MKDVRKLLSRQSKDILPDASVKESIKQELGYSEKSPTLAYAHGGQKTLRKNQLLALCAAALLLLCCLIGAFFALRETKLPISSIHNQFENITDADSFYAYGAASVGTILASDPSSAEPMRALSARAGDERVEAINKYMALVESLLSENAIQSAAVEGKLGYAYGMTVTYTDLLGETVQYTMYYDKQFLSVEADDDETEENYAIFGILVAAGQSYPVEGVYESKTSDDETEDELSFKAFTDETKRSYIEVSRENETETEGADSETESEYVYSVYADGKLVEETAIEYEKEGDELELKLTVEKGGKKEELTFRSGKENGERVLFARGKLDGVSVSFRVYIRQGEYHYVFDDGSSSDHHRFDDDDDDDDDDNDDDDEKDRDRRSL